MVLDGSVIEVRERGDKMLVELYRTYVGDYPKFFKMDTLSRLGFLAAELILREYRVQSTEYRDLLDARSRKYS